MKKEKETTEYTNPALANYTCDGQMTIQEWLDDSKQISIKE